MTIEWVVYFMRLCCITKKSFHLALKEYLLMQFEKIYPNTFVHIHKNLHNNLDLDKNDDYSKFLAKHNELHIINQFQEYKNKNKINHIHE